MTSTQTRDTSIEVPDRDLDISSTRLLEDVQHCRIQVLLDNLNVTTKPDQCQVLQTDKLTQVP